MSCPDCTIMHSPIQCPKREEPQISEEAFIKIDREIVSLIETYEYTRDDARTPAELRAHFDHVRKIIHSMVKK